MKTTTRLLLRFILICAAIGSLSPLMAQTTYLSVGDSTQASCNNDGQVNVYVYNGTAPYIYILSP